MSRKMAMLGLPDPRAVSQWLYSCLTTGFFKLFQALKQYATGYREMVTNSEEQNLGVQMIQDTLRNSVTTVLEFGKWNARNEMADFGETRMDFAQYN